MELRDYIEIGSQKAGSLTALGKVLDLSQPYMSKAKSHERALPIDAATKLADYIQIDLRTIIAANELATEKKEEKKNYWMQFIQQAKTAAYMIIALSVTSFMTAPEKAFANQSLDTPKLYTLQIIRNCKKAFSQNGSVICFGSLARSSRMRGSSQRT